ncbi:MAG: (Fe-S)-binding protein [Thermodesulfobacteriota bacterium]|nr:(Fe-S)-binding protein [Thermodesulfobacteriota bacterium]
MSDLREKTRLCSVCYKMCRDVCPIAGATRHEADSPTSRAFFAEQVMEEKKKLTSEIVDYFYRCAMCKACREACESGMDTSEIMLSARSELDDEVLPGNLKESKARIISGNFYGEDSADVKTLISKQLVQNKEKPLFYFGGRLRAGRGDTIKSTFSIMEKLGVDFRVMEDEPATGQLSYFLGFSNDAKRLGKELAKKIKSINAKTLVIFSADDLRMVKLEYPNLGIELENINIVSLPEFLFDILNQKKPSLSDWDAGVITYHDSCSLGRELRIFETPREIIRMVPKANLVEMAFNKDQAPCCGYGVGLEITHPEITKLMALRLVSLAEDAGAEVMVMGCPTCRNVILENLGGENDSNKPERKGSVDILDLPLFLERVL